MKFLLDRDDKAAWLWSPGRPPLACLRRGEIQFRRIVWWFPWSHTRWWVPRIWTGGDEWCNVPLCLTVPPFGCLLLYWRKMRTEPCPECWPHLDEQSARDHLPGGRLHGGFTHPEIPYA